MPMTTKEERRRDKLFHEQLGRMPVEYLMCHDQRVGHAWQPATLDTPDGNYTLGLHCTRCELECETFRDISGKSIRRYWHPRAAEFYFVGAGRRTREQRLQIEEEWQRAMLGRLPRRAD